MRRLTSNTIVPNWSLRDHHHHLRDIGRESLRTMIPNPFVKREDPTIRQDETKTREKEKN